MENKVVTIKCSFYADAIEVLGILESHGFRWRSGKQLLQLFSEWNIREYPIYLYLHCDSFYVTHGNGVPKMGIDADEIYSAQDFIRRNTEMTMKKEDLKNWMVVITREGYRYLVRISGTNKTFVGKGAYLNFDSYNSDLTNRVDEKFDIMKVYEYTRGDNALDDFWTFHVFNYDLIWVREEPVEMTVAEIEEKLGIKNLKIVKEG